MIRIFSRLLPKKQAAYINSLIGHRGITHSLAAMFLLPIPVTLIGYAVGYMCAGIFGAIGLAGGIVSHIFLICSPEEHRCLCLFQQKELSWKK